MTCEDGDSYFYLSSRNTSHPMYLQQLTESLEKVGCTVTAES